MNKRQRPVGEAFSCCGLPAVHCSREQLRHPSNFPVEVQVDVLKTAGVEALRAGNTDAALSAIELLQTLESKGAKLLAPLLRLEADLLGEEG